MRNTDATLTLEEWREAQGYDPETRTYAKREDPIRATPELHPGALRADGTRVTQHEAATAEQRYWHE